MTKMMTALLASVLAIPALALAQSTTQPSDQATQSTAQPADQASQSSAQPSDQTSQSTAQQSDDANKAAQSQANQAAENQVNGMNTMPHHTMSGTIGADGKTFTGNNTTYKVSNPNSVKDYANQPVSIEYQFNEESNTIHINKVIPAQLQH